MGSKKQIYLDVYNAKSYLIAKVFKDVIGEPINCMITGRGTCFAMVPRKGGRGVCATVKVDSVDEGKKLYDKWVNYFIRKGMK